mmetsp:Transcript_8038/g.7211  ORF Transcript_8038/g.7211 Transcript_8038/m.7211 type:complete len:100 (+) Transcript_8038:899-1198(+)
MISGAAYNERVDMWAAGITFYYALSKKKPFKAKEQDELLQKVQKAEISFKNEIWKTISVEAKTFVNSLLMKYPLLRPNPKSAQKSAWLIGVRSNKKCMS